MSRVLIEVAGGLASVVRNQDNYDIEIVDVDQLRQGASADVHRYWSKSLSEMARRHVRKVHPRLALRLDFERTEMDTDAAERTS
jgi:hypothetical protein